MEKLLNVSVSFALVLALSMLIERFLEIIKAVYDLLDSKFDFYRFWTIRAESIKTRLTRKLTVFEYSTQQKINTVIRRFSEMLIGNTQEQGTVLTISGDLVRTLHVKTGLKIIAISLGIGLAFWLNIDLVALWQPEVSKDKVPEFAQSIIAAFLSQKKIHLILSGIAMGLGSSPVHKIIIAIEKSRAARKTKGEQQ